MPTDARAHGSGRWPGSGRLLRVQSSSPGHQRAMASATRGCSQRVRRMTRSRSNVRGHRPSSSTHAGVATVRRYCTASRVRSWREVARSREIFVARAAVCVHSVACLCGTNEVRTRCKCCHSGHSQRHTTMHTAVTLRARLRMCCYGLILERKAYPFFFFVQVPVLATSKLWIQDWVAKVRTDQTVKRRLWRNIRPQQ